MKEDAESWRDFLRHLKERGLKGVRLFISDKSLGLLESLPDFFADAQWQRCMVHWYRNVLKLVPRGKAKDVAAMLKAIHAQENHEEATKKATHVAEKLREMRLGNSALMLVAARLRHIASSDWSDRRYLDMDRLAKQDREQEAARLTGTSLITENFQVA